MVVNPFILTPVNDNETNSPESIPLILDLGPESAIADSQAQPRAWLGMENPLKRSAGFEFAWGGQAAFRGVPGHWPITVSGLVVGGGLDRDRAGLAGRWV